MPTIEAKWPRPSVNEGETDLEFSFLSNGTSDPLVSSFRGRRCIATITRVSTGKYLCTLNTSAVAVVVQAPDLSDDADDGAYATLGSIVNEASASNIAFFVYTRNSGGTKTDFTGRRVGVTLCLKVTGVSPA